MSDRPVKYLDAEAFREKLESMQNVALAPGCFAYKSIGAPSLWDENEGVLYALRAEDRL